MPISTRQGVIAISATLVLELLSLSYGTALPFHPLLFLMVIAVLVRQRTLVLIIVSVGVAVLELFGTTRGIHAAAFVVTAIVLTILTSRFFTHRSLLSFIFSSALGIAVYHIAVLTATLLRSASTAYELRTTTLLREILLQSALMIIVYFLLRNRQRHIYPKTTARYGTPA